MMLTLNCGWAVPGDTRLQEAREECPSQRGNGINAIYGLGWRPQPAANDNQTLCRHG